MQSERSSAVIETILGRRSVRSGFSDRPIPQDQLDIVLACGLAAPSSKNARPWRFHVLRERSQREFVARVAVSAEGIDDWVPHDPRTGAPHPEWSSTVVESAEVLLATPCAIIIENRAPFSRGKRELVQAPAAHLAAALDGYAFELVGIGAALENLWLAANALGIRVAFLGDLTVAEDAIATRFGITGDVAGVVGLGYSSVEPPPRADPGTATDDGIVWH